jgi:hypothetical protein
MHTTTLPSMFPASAVIVGDVLSGATVTATELLDSGMVALTFADGHRFLYEAGMTLEVTR